MSDGLRVIRTIATPRITISRVPRRRPHGPRRRTTAVRSATRHTGGVGQDARQVCRTRAPGAQPAAYRRN